MSATLVRAKYGKDLVKVVKVSKIATDPAAPHLRKTAIVEMTCRVLLNGPKLESSYTQADNSLVVPTDTGKRLNLYFIKNTCYVLAKRNPGTLESSELFAHQIIHHFLSKYSHLEGVEVIIKSHNWTRVQVTTLEPVNQAGTTGTGVGKDGSIPAQKYEHPHSYFRAGDEKRTVHMVASRAAGGNVTYTTVSGLVDLLILKTTGSSFEGYHLDELTTLQPAADRLFSTNVDVSWNFASVTEPLNTTTSKFVKLPFDKIFNGVRQILIDLFANHDSPSVQNTLWRICADVIAKFAEVEEVSMALPNKHYIGYDLGRFGLKNTGADQQIFFPQADPSGYITATVGRKGSARL
ncbi:factor-independent urate hydroxylase [Synchytrium microbalum]|uniref:Uricase n=1 Tax=Synchytrium microbalum TaxID=1806994 RepID=A0A507CBB1_9FUNG|nr:factor-independent urate hydroxylase [Synchytrium microbalum]TPX36902.1 factor-independent urate hydroxylase [Synchytrium microbalum]